MNEISIKGTGAGQMTDAELAAICDNCGKQIKRCDCGDICDYLGHVHEESGAHVCYQRVSDDQPRLAAAPVAWWW